MDTRIVILVVDDEITLRDLVHRLLNGQGYNVLAAADGTEALELSRTHSGKINLLLTDVEMPRLDGISLYRRIRAERGIKVLFMSGGISDSLELPTGSAFLPKPFLTSTLCTKVREVLEMSSSRQM